MYELNTEMKTSKAVSWADESEDCAGWIDSLVTTNCVDGCAMPNVGKEVRFDDYPIPVPVPENEFADRPERSTKPLRTAGGDCERGHLGGQLPRDLGLDHFGERLGVAVRRHANEQRGSEPSRSRRASTSKGTRLRSWTSTRASCWGSTSARRWRSRRLPTSAGPELTGCESELSVSLACESVSHVALHLPYSARGGAEANGDSGAVAGSRTDSPFSCRVHSHALACVHMRASTLCFSGSFVCTQFTCVYRGACDQYAHCRMRLKPFHFAKQQTRELRE